MELKRREFLVGAAGFVPFAGVLAAPAGERRMRLGVMTDTHVGKTVESCGRVRQALELFKAKGAEMIINNGDIADWHYPTGYQAYRQVSEEVYGTDYHPREIFTYAWHDAFAYQGHARSMAVADGPAAFEDARRLLKAPNGHTAEIDFKGYKFLVMPQFTGAKGFLTWEEYEAKVAAACKATPDKPVFVVDHVPPSGTVYNSYNWGNASTRRVLNKYPQVVDFSGHVHGSLRNDLFIWQKEFTVINSGCLQVWHGLLAASAPTRKQSFGVLTVDVYDDRLLVRRWDVRDQSEIDAEHPWVVPLPFVAETAPYTRERRKAAEPTPHFGAADRLAVAVEGKPFKGFRLTFPEVEKNTMLYRIEAQRKGADGNWGTFTWLEIHSDYWVAPKDRTGKVDFLFSAVYFEPDGEYRFAVTPENQYGVRGDAIYAEAKAPGEFVQAKTIFESKDPMNEMELCTAAEKPKRFVADAEGFYGPLKTGSVLLKLPEGLFKSPKGTRFRATVDMRSIQPEEGTFMTITLKDPKEPLGVAVPTSSPGGDSGNERYVLEFTRRDKNPEGDYNIALARCANCRVKFIRVKVERLEA